MKRLVVLFALVAMLITPVISQAVGTVTETWDNLQGGIWQLNIAWTADAALATVPATATSLFNGFIYSCDTNPGTTAPTDDYDITLVNADGIDVMGSALLNRDTSTSERAYPTNTPLVTGGITFTLTNNAINSASGTLKCFILMSK